MLKKKLIYLEILASLLLYGCSPSVKQTQAAAEKTTIEVETTAEAKEPEIPYIEAADSFAGGSGTEEESGAEKEGRQMIAVGFIAAFMFVLALSRSAGLADRKMEEINMLSAAREAGGVDGN